MQQYYDELRKKKRSDAWESAKSVAKSSAFWGGLTGAADRLRSGDRSIPSILLRGLGTAAISAPMAVGATSLGHALLPAPDPNDPAATTTRGAVGGVLGGGLLGGGTGYLLGSGRLRGLAHLPHAAEMGAFAKKALPVDNLITDYLKKMAMNPSRASALKAAAVLGLTGAAMGGLEGYYAGESADSIRNLGGGEP